MKTFEEFLDEARELRNISTSKKSGTMPIPGAEGASRKDVARAGFRKRGPVQDPKVEKSGEDVPVWVRTHKSKGDYAAHTAKKAHKEGDKGIGSKMGELRKQFHKSGSTKDSEVHDITVGSPKKNIKEPGQKARAFVKTLKDVKDKMKERRGVATNTPTAISSSGKKRKRSDEEGAEQRGRIYQKLGMGERNPKTGVQMAKLKDSFDGKTFGVFILEVNRPEKGSDEERSRWDRVKAALDAKDNPGEFYIGTLGRDKNGVQKYGTKGKDAKQNQLKNRVSRLADIDSDLDKERRKQGGEKATTIIGRGKEHHHLTKISDSAKEFKGLTPEQRKEKREKDAKAGKFHGSDPRNIAQTDGPEGGTGIPHRGEGGYHSRQKAVGKGGSIQDIGSEKEIVAAQRRVARQGSASEKLAREKGIETPKMQRQREMRARMASNAKARGFD